VAKCADALTAQGIELVHPVTDQPFGHRTLFFQRFRFQHHRNLCGHLTRAFSSEVETGSRRENA
jgi:hypothetical protein